MGAAWRCLPSDSSECRCGVGRLASEELPELVAEVERLQHELRDAARRIKAFAKDCATHGDMTPMAKIQ
jgi:uncharacterized protein (UPF0335 family)